MKLQKIFRAIAIIFYLSIILSGQMIVLPLIIWLLFTLFDFGDIDQLFALIAIIGLFLICFNFNKDRTRKVLSLDLLCFFLLISPLVKLMTAVPIELFNYTAFIMPAVLFVLFYITSLLFGCKQYSQIKKSDIGAQN